MKNKKNQRKKLFAIIAIFIVHALGFINSVYAIKQINSEYIQSVKYKGGVESNRSVSYTIYYSNIKN